MNNNRRKTIDRNKMSVDFDKNMIKETILETYQEIQNEELRNLHTPTEFLKLPLSLIFYALKIILGFFAFVFAIVPGRMIYTDGFNYTTIFSGSLSVVIAILCGIFAMVCHRTGSEVEKETDKYYIVAYFSAIVSLVALIVALIGLIKVM